MSEVTQSDLEFIEQTAKQAYYEPERLYKENLELQKKCEQLETRLESARKVIGFYASSDNWYHVSPKEAVYSIIDEEDLGVGDFQLNSITDDDRVGGLKARKWMEEDKK